MSENPRSREHIHPLCLSAAHYVAISKLQGDLEIGKSAAILLALNEGLHNLGVLSDEGFSLLDKRYRRPLKDIIAENKAKREPSHVPVLTLEQLKKQKELEQRDRQFKGMLEDWNYPRENIEEWRQKAYALAEKYADKLQSARDILALKEAAS